MYRLLQFIRQIAAERPRGAHWSQLRYFPRRQRSLREGCSSVSERLPWISFPAIDRLKRDVKPTDRVFEYGGGGSTLFWADRVAEVVTVEHDAAWFDRLQALMAGTGRAKWTGRFVPATPGDLVPAPDPADPAHYASGDEASKGHNYKAYVEAIDAYPDGYFDIVLIDGRGRTSCIAHSIPKLKRGGLLVLDNAERTYYTERNSAALAQLEPVLTGMAPVAFSLDLSETRIYRRK